MDRFTFIVLLLVVVGCVTTGRSSLAKLPQEQGSKTPAVQVDMRNVMYHFTDQVAVHILQLHGLVLPTQGARLPVFDDVQSFTFAIHFAEIAIGTTSPHRGNHMAYRGAQLRFGKLTMSDTDLVLIDMDPQDPFDVFLEHYKEQLVAGYTKTTPDFRLRVFRRDFNKVQNQPSPRRAALSRQPAAPHR